MRLLTTFPHGSIPLDDEHPGRVDVPDVLAGRSDDRVEPSLCAPGYLRSSLAGA